MSLYTESLTSMKFCNSSITNVNCLDVPASISNAKMSLKEAIPEGTNMPNFVRISSAYSEHKMASLFLPTKK